MAIKKHCNNPLLLRHAPKSGEWVIYCINVEKMRYVGATQSFRRRMDAHMCYLEKIANGEPLNSLAQGAVYANFKPEQIRQHGYTLQVYAYCDSSEIAQQLELYIINMDMLIGISLNLTADILNIKRYKL